MKSSLKWLFITSALVVIALTSISCIGVEQTVTAPPAESGPAAPTPTISPAPDPTLTTAITPEPP